MRSPKRGQDDLGHEKRRGEAASSVAILNVIVDDLDRALTAADFIHASWAGKRAKRQSALARRKRSERDGRLTVALNLRPSFSARRQHASTTTANWRLDRQLNDPLGLIRMRAADFAG
jgi:hypothetical protein